MIRLLAIIGGVTITSIAGVALLIAFDVWRHRKGCRPTRESHRTRKCGDDGSLRQRARVGRPEFFYTSVDLPRVTTADSHDELWVKLSTEGAAILKQEQSR